MEEGAAQIRIGRQSVRVKELDYSRKNLFFVTICTDRQRILFGKIECEEIILSKIGESVKKQLLRSSNLRSEVVIHKYVIMPNHIHLIVEIITNGKGIERPRKFGKFENRSLFRFVAAFKAAVTTDIRILFDNPNYTVWQRGYHEKVIRDVRALSVLLDYIDFNPKRWGKDRYFNKG